MRIGMVTTFYPPFSYGGDATYVRSLASSVAALGHEVEVLASTDAYLIHSADEAPHDPTIGDGVTVHRLRHPAGFLAPLASHQTGRPMLYSGALNEFFARPFDVLHFHNISLMGAPAVLGMGQARARLLSLHDHWLICPTHVLWKNRSRACDRRTCLSCSIRSRLPPQLWRYTGLRDRFLEKIDRILAPSSFTAQMHRSNGIRRPIEVLPLFSSIERLAEPTSNQPNRILFVGRVTALKGIADLVCVVADMPQIELLVIGDGDLKPALVERYADCANIRFLAKVDQEVLGQHYADAAAVIVPSLVPETFGLSLVEAAAFGTPAIVAKCAGGAAEIVKKSGGGMLYDGNRQLADAISHLVNDRAHRDQMGRLANADYLAHYTRRHHIAAYLGHVRDLLPGEL